MHPRTLLFILIGVIPFAVAGVGIVSFLLLRAGYGPLAGMLLPFLVLLVISGGLGAILGRAASRGRRRKNENSRPRGHDDV